MKKSLLYWGSWKGQIIKAIVIDHAKYWNEILETTSLQPESLNKALSELYSDQVIQKNSDNSYFVAPQIYRKYKEFFDGEISDQNDEEKSKTVFVIHGRNLEIKNSLCSFLKSLKLCPICFSEVSHVTGKGSPYVGEVLDEIFSMAQAVIVLMTPDDEARLLEKYWQPDDGAFERELTPQARPNVLFEAGMAFGKYPDRTILIEMGNLRPFSDVGGRHKVKLNNSVEKRKLLAKRLESLGCPVSFADNKWKDIGDFTIDGEEKKSMFIFPNVVNTKTEAFEINNFPIDSKYLDEVFNISKNHAEKIFSDAKLTSFGLQFWPEAGKWKLTILNGFYSKFANKIAHFSFDTRTKITTYNEPPEEVKFDVFRKTLDNIPWKVSPNWKNFIQKYYSKVGPLSFSYKSYVALSTQHNYQQSGYHWRLTFFDGYNGKKYTFRWNGKQISEKNVGET